MEINVTQSVITAAVAIATVIASVAGVRVSRSNLVVDSALDLLTPYKDELAMLRVRVDDLEQRLQRQEQETKLMHRWALTLRAQVIDAGLHPVTLEEIMRLEKIEDGNV